MSVYTPSNTFPPFYDYDSLFYLSIDIPNNLEAITSSYNPQLCNKCGAFMLQEEHMCPVCNPEKFETIRDVTHFRFYQVALDPSWKPPPPPVCFILLDLDVPFTTIQSLITKLLEFKDESPYNSVLFSFGFLGYSIHLCDISSSYYRFFEANSSNDIIKHSRLLKDFLFLPQMISLAKKYMVSQEEKIYQINKLFTFFNNEMNTHPRINTIIYIFSGILPQCQPLKHPVFLHLLQISDSPSSFNIDFAIKSRASYECHHQDDPNIVLSLKKYITQFSHLWPQITINCSSGIYVKHFISPNCISSISGRKSSIVLPFFSNIFTPTAIVSHHNRSDYNNSRFFSVQILIQVFPDITLILNESWKKSLSIPEWVNSLSPMLFMSLYIQYISKKVLEISFKKQSIPWNIPEIKQKHSPGTEKAKKLRDFTQYIMDIFIRSKDPLFTENYRNQILVTILYMGPKIVTFLESLLLGPVNNQFFVAPPYIFVYIRDSYWEISHQSNSPLKEFCPILMSEENYVKFITELSLLRDSFSVL